MNVTPAAAHAAAKRGVLRQESVAWMNRLRARAARDVEDRITLQIALRRGRRSDAHGLVGELNVHGVRIGFRTDRHRANAEAARRPDDTNGDLAAIGNEDLVEHVYIRKTPNVVRSIGAFIAAEMPSPSTMRVSTGSMMPSSHSRALA